MKSSMIVGIQVESLGQRCGIYTYARRLEKALRKKGVNAKTFWRKPPKDVDIINFQYEIGLWGGDVNRVIYQLQQYPEILIGTIHNSLGLEMIGTQIDGFLVHDDIQISSYDVGWGTYAVIPHPAIYFRKRNKEKLRKKLNLPADKKIVGTAGFIAGTGKRLPVIVREILRRLKEDEFLYLATSFFKSDILSTNRLSEIQREVKKLGKEDNFRVDTEFVDDKTLNEKMQACDLLFTWNATPPDFTFSQSGIASDMYASHTKLIVKDIPHYRFIGSQEKVLKGRLEPSQFAEDVVNALRDDDVLKDIPDGKWLSWDNQVEKYIEFYKEFL